MTEEKFVSIIIPCRNEEQHISHCLESILQNDYPKSCMEVLVVDGMSEDRSLEILRTYAQRYPFIVLLENSEKYTPQALNIGLDRARGDFIILMGAHTQYPPNYISGLVSWLEKTDADAVGGVFITRPGNDTAQARAIAAALSHFFGIGNAFFRIGTKHPRWVDTVPFGCYRREVFDRIGKFDEELVRNQDDEFNLRLLKNGGRLLLVPEIISRYYSRDSLRKVWRMYFQYGYFKPLVARKVGGVLTLRQVVPGVFVLALLISGVLGLMFPLFGKLFLSLSLVYGLLVGLNAILIGRREGISCGLWLLLAFPTIHFSYGLGSIKGFIDFFLRRKARREYNFPLSR